MQRLDSTSLVLVGAGFVCAWLATESQKAAHMQRPVQEAVRIIGAPERDLRLTMSTLPRTFSAQAPLLPVKAEPDVSVSPVRTVATPTSALEKHAPEPALPALPWRTVVLADSAASSARALTSSKAGDVATRAKLARDLQQELKRVGCYGGNITGSWTPSTKRAMWAFMDRINASLPLDEPDYILLTLVQSHSGIACGADCKSGEVMSASGRCLPQAVVAQASKKSKSAVLRAEEKIKRAQLQRDQVVQRYADDHVAAKTAASSRRVATIDTRRPPPAPGAVETLPWLRDDQVALAPQADRRATLPGRMSVGAPLPTGADRSAGVAAVSKDARANVINDSAGDTTLAGDANTFGGARATPITALSPEQLAALEPQSSDAAVDGALVQELPTVTSGRKAGYRPARAKRGKYSYSSGKKRRRGYRGPGRPVYNMDHALSGLY